ncbi:hypothetical protein [Carboxylicivirga caseinilyticus]|uniref:hypothetical protein n=1 Tax=Carboxylicivirga caseinilyticus TaxID=3417572 RepID=UPI003D35726B|nr:hypothetical protein [Marinilabiliaceae bacterium A049]
MVKKVKILLLALFISVQLYAQRTDIMDKDRIARVDSLLDDILFEDEDIYSLLEKDQTFQFLYFATNYSNRTFYAGRENGDYQSNLSGQIYYMNSAGFFAGLSGSWYNQLDPNYRSTILTVGYGQGIKNKHFFRYRLSADYFIFHVNDPEFEPIYNSSINAGITLKSKSFGTRFDGSLLVGQEVGKQFTWNNYAYLYLLRFGKYNYLRLEPEVSLFFGSEAAEFLLNEAYVDQTTNLEVDTYYKDVFTLLNTQLRLPLSLNWKNFDMQLSYIYNIPRTIGDSESYANTSYFRLSLGYIISL